MNFLSSSQLSHKSTLLSISAIANAQHIDKVSSHCTVQAKSNHDWRKFPHKEQAIKQSLLAQFTVHFTANSNQIHHKQRRFTSHKNGWLPTAGNYPFGDIGHYSRKQFIPIHKKIEKLNSRHAIQPSARLVVAVARPPLSRRMSACFHRKIYKKSNSKSTKRFTSPDKAKLELQPWGRKPQ